MNKKGQAFTEILITVGIIAAIIVLILGSTYGQLAYTKFFKPKFADVERETWEMTKSRINAAVQDINTRMLEYNKAEDSVDKNAICAYLRNSYPTLDPSKIDDYKLSEFFSRCKYGG